MAKRLRPVLVWVAVALNAFGIAISVLGLVALLGHSVSLTESARAYYRSLSPLDWVGALIGISLSIAATIALFRLKKIAAPLLTAGFIFGILRVVKYTLLDGYVAAVGSMLIPALAFGLSAAICIYAWRLRAQGVLS